MWQNKNIKIKLKKYLPFTYFLNLLSYLSEIFCHPEQIGTEVSPFPSESILGLILTMYSYTYTVGIPIHLHHFVYEVDASILTSSLDTSAHIIYNHIYTLQNKAKSGQSK